MLLGKAFDRMDKALRTDQVLVQGCESKAWITVNEVDGSYYFQGDSDARIIRGLLAIVFAAFEGKTANQIQQFDFQGYFEQLGLLRHLSPSRGNGLNAIVTHILNNIS